MKNRSRFAKSLGVLQLLENTQFDHALIFNSWPYFNEKFSIHCNKLTVGSNSSRLKIDERVNLIIVFYPEKLDFELMLDILGSHGAEVIFVCSQYFTYNFGAQKELFGKIFNEIGERASHTPKKVLRLIKGRSSAEFVPLPDILNNEFILQRGGLKGFRRYWSWRKGGQGRSFISYLCELFFVKYTGSSVGAPFVIYKFDG